MLATFLTFLALTMLINIIPQESQITQILWPLYDSAMWCHLATETTDIVQSRRVQVATPKTKWRKTLSKERCMDSLNIGRDKVINDIRNETLLSWSSVYEAEIRNYEMIRVLTSFPAFSPWIKMVNFFFFWGGRESHDWWETWRFSWLVEILISLTVRKLLIFSKQW